MKRIEITYRQNGDYLIPNLSLPKEDIRYKNKTIGKYGNLRLDYIKNYKKGLYSELLLDNKLKEHLIDINEEAKRQVKLITMQIANQENITEELKHKDALNWVSAMNNAQARAEEIVLNDLIYV